MSDTVYRRIMIGCYIGIVILAVAMVLTACAKPFDVCSLPPSTMDAGQGCYKRASPAQPGIER